MYELGVIILVAIAGYVAGQYFTEDSFRREAEKLSRECNKLLNQNHVLANRIRDMEDELESKTAVIDSDTANYQEMLDQSERDLEQAKLEYSEVLREHQERANTQQSEIERLEGIIQRQGSEAIQVIPPKDYADEEIETLKDKAINFDAIRELATKKQWDRIAKKHNAAVSRGAWRDRVPAQRPTKVKFK